MSMPVGPTIVFALLTSAAAAPAPAELAVVEAVLYQYDGGPPVPSGFEFRGGETVFLRFRIRGFARSADSRIHLVCVIDALDGRGLRLVETERREIQAELAPQDKDWLPVVRHEFVIPPLIDSGSYRVVIRVEDKLSGRGAKAEVPFLVRGPMVQPSDSLVARNFRFLRGEDGPRVDGAAIYSRGEMLWARFEITGYKIGEQNRIHVSYGLAVLGPTGKEVYAEPEAAVEQSRLFYPHRYLPGILSLNLEKAQPGDYTLVLRIRDLVGAQEYEERHAFQVR